MYLYIYINTYIYNEKVNSDLAIIKVCSVWVTDILKKEKINGYAINKKQKKNVLEFYIYHYGCLW